MISGSSNLFLLCSSLLQYDQMVLILQKKNRGHSKSVLTLWVIVLLISGNRLVWHGLEMLVEFFLQGPNQYSIGDTLFCMWIYVLENFMKSHVEEIL